MRGDELAARMPKGTPGLAVGRHGAFPPRGLRTAALAATVLLAVPLTLCSLGPQAFQQRAGCGVQRVGESEAREQRRLALAVLRKLISER
jgi:hypothetical protein